MSKELDKELYPDYEYPEYTPNPEEPFREPIAKLGKLITDRVPQKLGLKKITREDPEYWGLAAVLSDEEAELALKLGGSSAENPAGNHQTQQSGAVEVRSDAGGDGPQRTSGVQL